MDGVGIQVEKMLTAARKIELANGKKLGLEIEFTVKAELMYFKEAKAGSITMWVGNADVTDPESPVQSISVGIGCDTWVTFRNGDAWRIEPGVIAAQLNKAVAAFGLLDQAKLVELGLAEWQKVERECPHCHSLNAVTGEVGELVICWNCEEASEYDGENLIQVD